MNEEKPSRRFPPLFDWNDADYCENGCPVCKRARQGNRLAKMAQTLELILTFGACPWGRARKRKYGVKPNEPLPPEAPEVPADTKTPPTSSKL